MKSASNRTLVAGSVRRARPLLGTFVEIVACGDSRDATHAAVTAAFDAVAVVDRLMSFHNRDSDVSRLNREAPAHIVKVDPLTFQVLETARELHELSGGLFDVTVASGLQRLGLLPADEPEVLPPTAPRANFDAVELLSGCGVRFHHPAVKIDLGGIAKGYAVDRAVEVLRSRGISSGIVNAGGDLFVFGREAHRVHIRNPLDPLLMLCHLDLANEALASSGNYAMPSRLPTTAPSAILHPANHSPTRSICAASVRAPSCTLADALTKVVILAGECTAPLLKRFGASALLVSAAGEVLVASDWKEALSHAA